MSTYIHLSTNLVQYEDSVVILFHELRRDTSIARRCQQLFQSAERVGGHIEVGQRHGIRRRSDPAAPSCAVHTVPVGHRGYTPGALSRS